MTVTIHTHRLRLRTPTVDDLPDYLAYRNDPATIQRMGMETTDKTRAMFFLRLQSELGIGASGWRMFGIERLEQAGLIGEVGVFLSEDDPNEGDLGWWLRPDHRRKGYATEAAQALAGWCLGERGLERVTAACRADNAASRSVMERIGMRLNWQSCERRQLGDQRYEEVGYALVRPKSVV